MVEKRKGVYADDASRSTTIHKRARHTAAPDLLSHLSDELLVRILSFLPLFDILNLAQVSDRFFHLSGDSQIWKRLYYSRFVLPRALRLPGFRNGSTRDGKLHYSSRRTIWADGRKGGWVDMRTGEDKESLNWKRQYKLRHNWAKGKCAVEELQLGDEHKVLVKVVEGIAVTADATTGIRAWDLKTKQLLAQVPLYEGDATSVCTLPSCMALDDQDMNLKILRIALGFTDGSFGTWQLHMEENQIARIYRHEGSINGEVVSITFLHPYLLTATKSVLISLYTFDRSPLSTSNGTDPRGKAENDSGIESVTTQNSDTETYTEAVPPRQVPAEKTLKEKEEEESRIQSSAPYLLTSLKSHTSRAPLALSLRKTTGETVASIAYTFSTIRGWCLGIQELHIRSLNSRSRSRPEITTTQLAYTLPVQRTVTHIPSPPPSPASQSQLQCESGRQLDGPISLSYTHPYLLATLPDNTLVLHRCTSSSSSLSISPGIRLWGHTSGISDAEITARGKAVSVSSRGEEIRVWELEGRTNGRSIEVRPVTKAICEESTSERRTREQLNVQWDDRRNWVGFDDEMVIVLKESSEGKESLLVYDFT